MDVILHIGAHRTATSAMQHHMAYHRSALADSGAVYWGPKITRGGLFRGAIGGVEGVMAWQGRRFAGRCAMRAEVVRQTGATHLIVSDENMFGSMRGTLEDTRIYPDAGRRVAAYATGFSSHRVTVAMCVRDYADWWTSALAFRLMRGGPLPRTALREHLVTQPRRWRHLVEEIARALPAAKVVVWNYERMANKPHDIVEELTGITTAPSTAMPRNARPTAAALHDLMLSCDIDPKIFHWPEGQFMPFTTYETEALRAQYNEDLSWLANGAGGFADYFDAPAAQTGALTVEGKGFPDDAEHRKLA
ncbi:MAG TPA: hypothetical protein EYP31_06660 [Roseibacterium sp.]|nr:hypothetical protein [Roseibacterium sp.]